jgi:hypothetical protein
MPEAYWTLGLYAAHFKGLEQQKDAYTKLQRQSVEQQAKGPNAQALEDR